MNNAVIGTAVVVISAFILSAILSKEEPESLPSEPKQEYKTNSSRIRLTTLGGKRTKRT